MGAVRWGRVLAIVLGVALALWLLGGDRTPEAQDGGEPGTGRPLGSWGSSVPEPVGTQAIACPGYVLAVGTLEAAEHEQQDGYFNVGLFAISVPREGIPAAQLRLLRGKDVEIVVRERRPRELKGIAR